MRKRCGPMFEALEARQFLSTTAYLGNQCLPPPPTPPVFQLPPPRIAPVEGPAPTPQKPPKSGGSTGTSGVSAAAMVGDWTGTHFTANEEQSGAMSLRVMMT